MCRLLSKIRIFAFNNSLIVLSRDNESMGLLKGINALRKCVNGLVNAQPNNNNTH